MAASSNIVIDPKPFISLSKELKDIRDVLIDSRTYSATIEGSIRRIEKGGFLDFVSKSALQTGKVKDKDPEVSTALKKLANFLDQKVDRTKEQKIETPTEKIVQPTIFKSIIQNTHKLVEDITSKSIEEHKKTKYTESSENKNSNILSSQLKQLSNFFNKKSEPVTQKVLNVQPVQQDKQTKDVSQTNNGTLKQITALLDANKTNKADIKNVDIKKDDNSLPKILKSIESLASSKKDEIPKSKEQDSGIFKKLTAGFENFKDTQNKNLNIKVDDSALQKVIKSFSFFSESKETPKKQNTQSIKSNEYKSVEQGVKQLQPVKSADSSTKQLKVNQTPPTLSKDPATTTLDRNDNVLIKKLSAFFDGFKTTNTLLNKSSNLEDSTLQKVLKSFALLKPSRTDDAKPVLNKPTVDKAITTNNVTNRTTQNINFEDTFLQKILKALDQKTYQKEKETTSNKQLKATDVVPVATQPNTLKTLQVTPLKTEEVTLQKVLKSIELLKPSKREESVKTPTQGEDVFKRLSSFVNDFKAVKSDVKNVDVKKEDNSLQNVLKSIEFLKPSKEENVKTTDQSDTLFKKMSGILNDFKAVKSDVRNIDIKKDDNSLQKILKSIEFLKPSKKEESVKTPTQGEDTYKKMLGIFNNFKVVKSDVKNVDVKKDDNSLQKIFKSIEFLKPSKKEESVKTTDQSDTLYKKMSSFFGDVKTAKGDARGVDIKKDDNSLQKILKSIEFLKPSKKEESVKPTDQSDTLTKKLTGILNEFKSTKSVVKNVDINKDDNSLQKILKSIEFLKPSKKEESVKTTDQSDTLFKKMSSFFNDGNLAKNNTKNVDIKKDDNSLQKILKSIEFLKPGKKEEDVKTPDQSDTLTKKLSAILNSVKPAKNDVNSVDIKKDDNSLQKILKSIEFLKPSKKEESVKQTDQSQEVFKKLSAILNEFKPTKSVVKNVDVNKDDNSLQKILKSIEFLKPGKKEESIKTTDQSEGMFKKLTVFLGDVKAAKSDVKNVDIKKDDNSLQKILKSIEFLKPSKKEESVKTTDQSDTLYKKMSSFFGDVKAVKSDVKNVDIKKDDNSLQKILKSIEFLKPGKKEESIKTTDQSDGLFKNLTSFLGDVKAVKSDVKNVDIKKDDNSLQKILKSIEFLKPGKKEETVKTSDQSDTLFKKMSSVFNSLKPTKDDVKNVDVKKDDNSLQKILKSIEFLKPSKKEEDVKPSDQSEGLFKKLTAFLKDSKNNKTEGKNVDIKSDDSSLQKVLKSVAFLHSSKKKEETSDTKNEDTQEPPKLTKQSFISSSITAVKEKLTNAFLPKSANNQDKSYNTKDNVPATPNIVERINSLKTLNEKQYATGQDKDNTKPLTPVVQKIVEQKTTAPVVTQLQPQTVQATSAKLAAPLANTKPEGEAQKELFAKEDINEKILKTLEHIDRTAKEILKTISGKHEDMTTKKESKKENEKEPQSESSGTSPLDLLDLIPSKLKQKARIFAKKGARAARRVFTKGKTLVAKGGSALKSATGKAITAGKTLINKAAGTAVGKTVAKGATALKTTAGTVLEKGSTAVKSVTGKALEAGKGVVSKITNTGVVKNAGETIAKGTSAIKTTAGTMLEKGSTAVKNVTSKALEAGKDIASKVASPETVKNVGETVSKGASNIKTAASNMIEKGGSAVKSVTGKALEAGKGLLGKIASTGAATAGTGVAAVGQAAQAGGTISKAAGLGTSLLKSGGKALGFLGKAAKAAGSAALKVGKAIPGVGGVIGTGMAAYGAYSDIQEINEKVKSGEMTEEEATVAKSKAIGKGIGSAAGSFIPGVGGLVGDLAGGYIGDKLGGVVGNALVSNKKTGEQNTPPAPELSTSTAPTSVATDTVNNTSSTNQPQTVPANSATPPATTAVNSTPPTPSPISTELKPTETLNASKEVSSNTSPTLGKSLKPESLWDKAKNIGTKAIQYATPIGAALTAGTAIYNKLTTPTTTNAATPQTTSIPTPSVAKGADSHQALKQVAEGIASSNSNDKDLAASILKMSEALVSAGLMKAPPIELNNIIQGNNSPPKIDLESVFGNNNDPIRSVRGEFAV